MPAEILHVYTAALLLTVLPGYVSWCWLYLLLRTPLVSWEWEDVTCGTTVLRAKVLLLRST